MCSKLKCIISFICFILIICQNQNVYLKNLDYYDAIITQSTGNQLKGQILANFHKEKTINNHYVAFLSGWIAAICGLIILKLFNNHNTQITNLESLNKATTPEPFPETQSPLISEPISVPQNPPPVILINELPKPNLLHRSDTIVETSPWLNSILVCPLQEFIDSKHINVFQIIKRRRYAELAICDNNGRLDHNKATQVFKNITLNLFGYTFMSTKLQEIVQLLQDDEFKIEYITWKNETIKTTNYSIQFVELDPIPTTLEAAISLTKYANLMFYNIINLSSTL